METYSSVGDIRKYFIHNRLRARIIVDQDNGTVTIRVDGDKYESVVSDLKQRMPDFVNIKFGKIRFWDNYKMKDTKVLMEIKK